jgi:hypothetical protein
MATINNMIDIDGKRHACCELNQDRPPLRQVSTNCVRSDRLITPAKEYAAREYQRKTKCPRIPDSYNNPSRAAHKRTRRAKEKRKKQKAA